FEHGHDDFAVWFAAHVEARTEHADLAVAEHHAERPRFIVHDVEERFPLQELDATIVVVTEPANSSLRVEIRDAAFFEGHGSRLARARDNFRLTEHALRLDEISTQH